MSPDSSTKSPRSNSSHVFMYEYTDHDKGIGSINKGNAKGLHDKTSSNSQKPSGSASLFDRYGSDCDDGSNNALNKKGKTKSTKVRDQDDIDELEIEAYLRLGKSPGAVDHRKPDSAPTQTKNQQSTENNKSVTNKDRTSIINPDEMNITSSSPDVVKKKSSRKKRLLEQLGPVPTDIKPRRAKPVQQSRLANEKPLPPVRRHPTNERTQSMRPRKHPKSRRREENLSDDYAGKDDDDDDDDDDKDEDDDDDGEYEVEAIVSHQIYRNHVLSYMVKWKGYDDTENTKEPALKFHEDCRELCLEYWRSQPIVPVNAPTEHPDPIHGKKSAPPSEEKSLSPSATSIWDLPRPIDSLPARSFLSSLSPSPPTSALLIGKSRNNSTHLDIENEDFDMDHYSDSDEYVPDKQTRTATESPTFVDIDFEDKPLISTDKSTMKPNGKSPKQRKDRIPDMYGIMAKEKSITQSIVAANYRKVGFELVYTRSLQRAARRLDWTSNFTIRNILPVKGDSSQLLAYLIWPSGLKTVHLIQELHDKCPKKLCLYYEERIRYS